MVHTDSSDLSVPEHLGRTLINLKTQDAREEFHRKVKADWNPQLGEPPIPPNCWESHMRHYLLSVYEAICEVWKIQGEKKTPESIRRVFREDIRALIKENWDTLRNHPRVSHIPDEAREFYLGDLENSAKSVHHDLLRRIEFEALELGYREGIKKEHSSEESDLPRGSKRGREPKAKVEERTEIIRRSGIHTKQDWHDLEKYKRVCSEMYKKNIPTLHTQDGFKVFPGCSWEDIGLFTGRKRDRAVELTQTPKTVPSAC